MLGGVGDHLGPAGKLIAETLLTPRGDDFDAGREGGGGEFETDLIIAFAGGPVGDGVGSVLDRGADHAFGDTGTGDGGAEEILAFVDRASLDHGEDVVGREGVFEITDDAFRGTGLERFFLETVEFLLLSDVGAIGNHVGLVGVFEPGEKDGGVEASGVGHQDFFDVVAHERIKGFAAVQ